MPATLEQLERFHRFAKERVLAENPAPSLDDLLMDWYDAEEEAEIHVAIERGIAQMEAGLGRPAREVTEEIFKRLGISET